MSAPTVDQRLLHRLRLLGLIEGVSTLVLFGIAMPMKYFGDTPRAVAIAGPVHGALFVALVGMFVWAVRRVPIPWGLALGGIFGAVVPGGPFVVDRWLRKLAPSAPG